MFYTSMHVHCRTTYTQLLGSENFWNPPTKIHPSEIHSTQNSPTKIHPDEILQAEIHSTS